MNKRTNYLVKAEWHRGAARLAERSKITSRQWTILSALLVIVYLFAAYTDSPLWLIAAALWLGLGALSATAWMQSRIRAKYHWERAESAEDHARFWEAFSK